MNKTLIFLSAALVLATAAYFFLDKQDEKLPNEAYPERQLAVNEADKIAKIFIADLNGRSMTFALQEDGNWLINNEFKASPAILTEMLRVLYKIRIDHVPPAGVVAKVMENFKTSSLKVESFDANGKQLNSIIIGPSSQDERNSYVLREGYNEPFAVRVPGLSGTIRPLFDLRSVEAFRSKDFIEIDPVSIKEVRVDYTRQPGESFIISQLTSEGNTTGKLALSPLNNLVIKNNKEVDQRFLMSYFEGFASVSHQGRITKQHIRDSVLATEPFMSIELQHADGVTDLKLYPAYILDQWGEIQYDGPIPTYFVLRDSSDFVTVQTPQLQSWLRGYSNFFE